MAVIAVLNRNHFATDPLIIVERCFYNFNADRTCTDESLPTPIESNPLRMVILLLLPLFLLLL